MVSTALSPRKVVVCCSSESVPCTLELTPVALVSERNGIMPALPTIDLFLLAALGLLLIPGPSVLYITARSAALTGAERK
jgi:hypothetical protein